MARLIQQWRADVQADKFMLCEIWCGLGADLGNLVWEDAEMFRAHTALRHLQDLIRNEIVEPEAAASPLGLLLQAVTFDDDWNFWGCQHGWALGEDVSLNPFRRSEEEDRIFLANEFDVIWQAQPELLRALFRKFVTAPELQNSEQAMELIANIRRVILEKAFVFRDENLQYGPELKDHIWSEDEDIPLSALVTLPEQTMVGFRAACERRHPAVLLREGLTDEEIELFFFPKRRRLSRETASR